MAEFDPRSAWKVLPPLEIAAERRLEHVRLCSDFAAGLLDRFPHWLEGLEHPSAPSAARLVETIGQHGLEAGLRRFRNREMLRIVWRDLCGLATLGETFCDLTRLAEICLQAALDEHRGRLVEQHGQPLDAAGRPQQLFVIGLGKLGGWELNLSSDIDIIFCFPQTGQCDGRNGLSNDQFFTRQARAVIASLGEITEDGFCFRVDTRLRPFGDSGPLTSSIAAMEQYYQREGRDWERYALVKARPVAGDLGAGAVLIDSLRPFVYRRYIDYGSVEALQEMHANVREDAQRKDRLDDIKRGPGGIREIEFLVQCFQILRGGRETALQTPSLDRALSEIEALGLLDAPAAAEIRRDYGYLRLLENRIQALRDQQSHRLPRDADRERVATAMGEPSATDLVQNLEAARQRVGERFRGIFPSRPEPQPGHRWADQWRAVAAGEPDADASSAVRGGEPLAIFVRRLQRIALSQRARQRLDRFMPELLERLDQREPGEVALNRVFDLVLAICRRSAYLVLLVQQPKALDRMLELFERSDWIADQVIRFPALLDELIDPSLGQHIPTAEELARSVDRILATALSTETLLENLNYLKLANTLRIAVGQLQADLSGDRARLALSDLAAALLGGVLELARREIEARHGALASAAGAAEAGQKDRLSRGSGLAIVAYGSFGARELAYSSDLDVVFLFEAASGQSDGDRPLPPERYFARLAQRVLSFLTVLTPSGRLYEVDTRLRPNGRAGSLVSSISAFREYQLKDAWTWELQALTRARFVTGDPAVGAAFDQIRRDALARPRNEASVADELLEMRERMNREHEGDSQLDTSTSAKHRTGGLIDIEFLAQLGVLAAAHTHPQVLQPTDTLGQLRELEAMAWLSRAEYDALRQTLQALWHSRMMSALLPRWEPPGIDTDASAEVVRARLGPGRGH